MIDSAPALAIASTSASLERGTIMRDNAIQVWPEFTTTWLKPPPTASTRSASSRIISGDLPPNSSPTRLMVSAATDPIRRPVPVEPVNDTLSTSGWATSASPTSAPVPVRRLNTVPNH